MSRIQHSLENRLTGGGEVVNLTPPPRYSSRGRSLLEALSTPGTVRLEGLGKLKDSDDVFGIRTRVLPACSIAPQPSMLSRVPGSVMTCSRKHVQKSVEVRGSSALTVTRLSVKLRCSLWEFSHITSHYMFRLIWPSSGV
jgi:hypothetical protein